MVTINELIILNRRLTAIATQVIDDVEDMAKTSDHAIFYERMVANAQDFETALQIQDREKHKKAKKFLHELCERKAERILSNK